MPKSRIVAPPFEYCNLCLQRARLANQPAECPARDHNHLDEAKLQHILEQTPMERWETPKDIGKRFGYSPKHVIRLATQPENLIAKVNIFGRWLVSRCSFHGYLERSASEEKPDKD